MNEIKFLILIEGKVRQGILQNFTSKSLVIMVDGYDTPLFMTREVFHTWLLHPEIDLKACKVTMQSGYEALFLK